MQLKEDIADSWKESHFSALCFKFSDKLIRRQPFYVFYVFHLEKVRSFDKIENKVKEIVNEVHYITNQYKDIYTYYIKIIESQHTKALPYKTTTKKDARGNIWISTVVGGILILFFPLIYNYFFSFSVIFIPFLFIHPSIKKNKTTYYTSASANLGEQVRTASATVRKILSSPIELVKLEARSLLITT